MYNQDHYSTFECLPGELILELFEYFNTKEILQSFFNLTAFINACVFDRRQQLHLYLDHQMSFFPANYAPDKIISLYIEKLIIPIRIYPNLKSLHIVYDNENKIEWLDMVKQVRYFKHGKSEFTMKLGLKYLFQLLRLFRFLSCLNWSASHYRYLVLICQKRIIK